MASSAVEMMNKSSAEVLEEAVTSVFQPGKLAVETIQVDSLPTPPIPVFIVAPKDAGMYPVAMLLHGFFLHNHFYQQLLGHIASHGFIMVAPPFNINLIPAGDAEDIASAAKVADWLPKGLPSVLPKGVEPELSKLALAGHNRGGHTAFSLALGHANTQLSFSALIGLDPVAGTGEVLPALAQDTNLRSILLQHGEEKKNIFFPPCAARDVNHAEFYRECKPPCYYFVTKDYGHLDMLDDDAPKFITCVCKDGNGCKDKMRRCVAGIMVAFLNAALGEKDGDVEAILRDPAIAPTTLDPAEHHLE